MSILDAAAALLGGLLGDDKPSRPARPQGPGLNRGEVKVRREVGLPTTARSVRVKDATHLTRRALGSSDETVRRNIGSAARSSRAMMKSIDGIGEKLAALNEREYQPGMRSAFGLPTRAAHSRMRMDDFNVPIRSLTPSQIDKKNSRSRDLYQEHLLKKLSEDRYDRSDEAVNSLGGAAAGAGIASILGRMFAQPAVAQLALPAGPRMTGMAQTVPGTGGPVGPAGLLANPAARQIGRAPNAVGMQGQDELASIVQRLLGSGPRGLPNGQYNMGPAQPVAPFQMPPNGGYPLSLF